MLLKNKNDRLIQKLVDIHIIYELDHFDIFKYCIDNKICTYDKDILSQSYGILQHASESNNLLQVKYICDLDIDIHCGEDEFYGPLEIACYAESMEVIDFLLDRYIFDKEHIEQILKYFIDDDNLKNHVLYKIKPCTKNAYS